MISTENAESDETARPRYFSVAYRTDLFVREVQERFVKVWSLDSLKSDQVDSPMRRLLCPRNVMLLAQPENDALWPIYGKFLKRLLEAKILDGDDLSDQCVALFRQDWPVVSVRYDTSR